METSFASSLPANLGYSDVAFRFWPQTTFFADQENFFFGADLSDAPSAFNYSARLGLMWRATPKWQFGLVYQSKTQGDYEDGKLVLNMESVQGIDDFVTYDAAVENFTWPEQFGVGVQWRPGQNWMIALDVKRYNWSDAVSEIAVTGTNPDNAFAFPEVEMPFTFLWEDHTVYALGFEYRLKQDATLRWGYNHGDSPVPDSTLNPLFPATTVDHLTVGGGWNWGRGNTFNVAVERAFEASQTNSNTNPMLDPFAGSTIKHSQWTVSFGYSKAFSRNK